MKARRKGPGRDSSSAKAIATAERHAEWVEKRKHGWTYRRIAAEYSVAPSTVEEAVSRCLLAVREEPARELRALELEALDDLIDQTLDDLIVADDVITRLACREAVRKFRADRRKLLGLDAPQKLEVSRSPEELWGSVKEWLKSPTPELEAALKEAGWRRE